MQKSIVHFSPSRMIIASIILAIGLGTFLLSLPIAQTKPVSLLDSFFMATSAICVCGLSTVSLFNFSFTGHCIILALMQIGGLSLVTLTLFLLAIFVRKFGLRTQLMASQLMELESWRNFKTTLYFTISVTIITELLGTIAIYFTIKDYFPWQKGMFLALFHSVSTFCHAGFTIFPDHMISLASNAPLLLISCVIMTIGGFGFFALYDLANYFIEKNKHKHRKLALHTQIVIIMTAIMTIVPCLLYWIVEHHNTLSVMTPGNGLINTLFNVISARGTGFSTISIRDLQLSSLILILVVAFIGAAPNSTGSGIKTTTVALIFAAVKASVSRSTKPTLRGCSIAKDQMYRALAIFFLSITFILFVLFCLLITEKGHSFIAIGFETVSAFATLGLSLGITPYLTLSGKLFIILTMIMGRIGPLGFVLAMQKQPETPEFSYPEERILLG